MIVSIAAAALPVLRGSAISISMLLLLPLVCAANREASQQMVFVIVVKHKLEVVFLYATVLAGRAGKVFPMAYTSKPIFCSLAWSKMLRPSNTNAGLAMDS